MKKQWITVKCGLINDPKHRQAMGETIWLYLYILDCATWEDGIVHEWRDTNAAKDMEMPIVTLRWQRRKLDELGYITSVQKLRKQDIIIHNWTNPREYTGERYNPKPVHGDNPLPPLDVHGDNPLPPNGSRCINTTTLYSNKRNQIKEEAAKPPTPPEVKLYREVVGLYPNSKVYDHVVDAVQSVAARLGREVTVEDLAPFFMRWCTKSGNKYNFSVWLQEWAVSGTSTQRPFVKENKTARSARSLQDYVTKLEKAEVENVNA